MNEYRRCLAQLEAQVATGLAAPARVEKPYSGSTLFDERWFTNLKTGKVWRLVAPDAPFRGLFNRADSSEF